MNSLGFTDGVRIFSRAVARTWTEPELRRWYFKTLVATVIVACLVVAAIFALAMWGAIGYFDRPGMSLLLVIVSLIAVFYFGGQLATLIMNTLVLVISGETRLTRFYLRNLAGPPPLGFRSRARTKLKDHLREVGTMLASFAVSCVTWPLFLFPLTMPVGVIFFAWALAREALATSRRLCHERGYEALEDREKIAAPALIGLALFPSSLALLPVIGWALMPVLQVAGLEMQLRSVRRGDSENLSDFR